MKANPFVAIEDAKTFEAAKKARTALVKARTAVQAQDAEIASKIKQFRNKTIDVKNALIAITQPHEEKQQEEVRRWEQIKEQEKAEKARIEQERIDAIQQKIQLLFNSWREEIKSLTHADLEAFKMRETLDAVNIEEFEEFELDFVEKKELLDSLFDEKKEELERAEAQRTEAERLRKEREQLDAERKALEKKAADAQAKIDAERKKVEEDRKQIEAEKQAKADAAAKAAAEAAEAKRLKAAKKREAALKPEKEQVVAFINSLHFTGEKPEIKDRELKTWLDDVIQEATAIKDKFKNELFKL